MFLFYKFNFWQIIPDASFKGQYGQGGMAGKLF